MFRCNEDGINHKCHHTKELAIAAHLATPPLVDAIVKAIIRPSNSKSMRNERCLIPSPPEKLAKTMTAQLSMV
jgi:hypothetical protein